MNVEKMTTAIRLRHAWEAVDLGVSMGRQWFKPLFTIWLMLALPTYLLVSLIPINPNYLLILFWLFKPFYEKPMMYYLSRVLFGEFPSLTDIRRSLWSIIKPNFLKEISLWRISLSRSAKMPVSLLEGLTGQERNQRLAVLSQGQQGSTQWMTIVFLHVEMFLYASILTSMYFFIPSRWTDSIDYMTLMQDPPLWLAHLSNLCYVAGAGLVAPFFVACGFALYISRRAQLEGWDIELRFKQLANQYKKNSDKFLDASKTHESNHENNKVDSVHSQQSTQTLPESFQPQQTGQQDVN